jgi:hypothetical protein
MREVAMAPTPAAIYEAGTLELRDEIANLGWHGSKTCTLRPGMTEIKARRDTSTSAARSPGETEGIAAAPR